MRRYWNLQTKKGNQERTMDNCYTLRLYDDELLTFSLEEKGLEGLKSYIISIDEDMKNLFPLDLELTDEGIF